MTPYERKTFELLRVEIATLQNGFNRCITELAKLAEELDDAEAKEAKLALRSAELAEALRKIMVAGTGSQGNSVEATIAYEALGEAGMLP